MLYCMTGFAHPTKFSPAQINNNLPESLVSWCLAQTLTVGVSYTLVYMCVCVCRLSTEIILVPSHRDIHHQPVYPQPPYVIKKDDSSVGVLDNFPWLCSVITTPDDDMC